MRLTLLGLTPDGHTDVRDGQDDIEKALADSARPFWLDVEDPDPGAVDWLAHHFQFHPLPLEDLLQSNLRPKLETYEGYVFLIAHSVVLGGDGPVGAEIQSFLARDYLVTVHDKQSAILRRVQRILESEAATLRRGPDHVLYLILTAVADSFFDAIDVVDDQIDALESRVLGEPDDSTLDAIFTLRRTMALMRRYASPLRDALDALLAHEGELVRTENEAFVRDVRNMMVTVHEIVESQRDLTSGVLDAYLSHTSNRLAEVVKRLTIVATVFLPVSFVAGVFGTNFEFMPFDSPVWFWLFVAAIVLTPAGMLVWFKREGWL
ncbi:MAG: magnesium/cobalt transporter CorA [Chloroflexota bacterium]